MHSVVIEKAHNSPRAHFHQGRQFLVRSEFTFDNRRGYRHVAVVDDIVTTGSTADEITRALHRAGVEYVEIWALARAYRR